jgi:MerR family copper efflux transcriptional regulator
MNIGEASERSGLPSKTIRYYEEIGLIRPDRGGNGYRDYALADIHKLRFLQKSRGLGFSVEECRQLAGALRGQEPGKCRRQGIDADQALRDRSQDPRTHRITPHAGTSGPRLPRQ